VIEMNDKELISRDKQEVQSTGELTKPGLYFTPDVDIYENEAAIVLIADMPGVRNDDVDIRLEDNELRIDGRVLAEKIGSPLMEEYRIGNYSRTFALSNMIDQGKILASMKDGVLRIELPKSEAAKPKKIAIKTG
jgi:HSP20 family molecular chaperone IbpA